MADVTATAHVWPSANDLEGGQPVGWGKTAFEKNLSSFWMASRFVNNFVLSGAQLPASDPDLTIQVPTGKFWLDGHFLEVAATNLTLGASNTHHIFLKLLKDGNGNVSSVAYEHNTTGTAPADSTKIGTATTDADNVTSTTDARITPGVLVSLGAGTYTVPAGITKLRIRIIGASGGGGGGGSGISQGCIFYPGEAGDAGAAGGYADVIVAVTPGAAHTITLGAAGGAGAAGTAGGAGGTTSVGALVSATGGGGGKAGGNGAANAILVPTASGAAGLGSGGTINQRGGGHAGGSGGAGNNNNPAGGTGSAGTAGTAGSVIVEYLV